MDSVEELLQLAPYSLSKANKSKLLNKRLFELTRLHQARCAPYARMLEAVGFNSEDDMTDYERIPFLPVSLFKELTLRSIDEVDVYKTMTSSGTSGQAVSRIYLDKATAGNQQKALGRIVGEFLPERCPMLIIDSPSVIRDREQFSARGAGILGFSIFGFRPTYALKDDMSLDMQTLRDFMERTTDKPVFLFGFTFMVWQHFVKALRQRGETLRLNGVMIHGGGWKKLIGESVSPEDFRNGVREVCGVANVHDYYGMVEQTGSIYMECEKGHLHASNFSDVIMRDPLDWSICPAGKAGVIQVVSTLPESYPGHSLLTEDEGILLGVDNCPCGKMGKYFKVLGRLPNAEVRGCSDTYAQEYR